MTVRLDDEAFDALVAWVREQIAAEDEPARGAHTALLEMFRRHLRAYTSAGEVSRRGVKLLASGYRGNPGFRDEWLP